MKKESTNNLEKLKGFNLYYMNLNKVFEISMMINNVIISSYEKEFSTTNTRKKQKKAVLQGKAEAEYLASIKSVLESSNVVENTTSSKVIEKLDVKTTKSILLKQIKNKAEIINNFNKCVEGDLILLQNIELSILDKENLRQILLLKRDALKGMQIEGIELNNLISSMIKDYSYILSGELVINNNTQKFVIKIPFELENEFENNYNIDDIVLGKVSIIGIYKNKNSINDISINTLNYFSGMNSSVDSSDSKFIKSNKKDIYVNPGKSKSSGLFHYIDIIGIIQEIKFTNNENTKPTIWEKVKSFLLRGKNEK